MSDAECMTSCRASPAIYRSDFVEASSRCYETLACDVSSRKCDFVPTASVDKTEIDRLLRQCIDALHASCPNDYSNTDCDAYPTLVESVRQSFLSCLPPASCDAVCTRRILGTAR